MNDVTKKILEILQINKISYETIEHEIASTCEDAAQLRSMPLEFGAKSILFKDKSGFKMFTLPANKQIDNSKVRKILKSQKLRFATLEELKNLAGVEKGALPPITRDLYDFEHFIDKLILENSKIVFNAGILTMSIIMNLEDYLKLIDKNFLDFSY